MCLNFQEIKVFTRQKEVQITNYILKVGLNKHLNYCNFTKIYVIIIPWNTFRIIKQWFLLPFKNKLSSRIYFNSDIKMEAIFENTRHCGNATIPIKLHYFFSDQKTLPFTKKLDSSFLYLIQWNISCIVNVSIVSLSMNTGY